MKKVAIVQSNYIPWKGYFDLIAAVDEFILFDSAQYTRRDWRNRNLLKTPQGLRWLTIPVDVKGMYLQKINETRASGTQWRRSHWDTLRQNYRKAPHFSTFAARFEALFLERNETTLSRINYAFIVGICEMLQIRTRISWDSDYTIIPGRTERLVELCKSAGADSYLSGPLARDYIDPTLFDNAGITLEYMDYTGYPEYPQLHGKFEHGVTILDLIFNAGPDSTRFMKFADRKG